MVNKTFLATVMFFSVLFDHVFILTNIELLLKRISIVRLKYVKIQMGVSNESRLANFV